MSVLLGRFVDLFLFICLSTCVSVYCVVKVKVSQWPVVLTDSLALMYNYDHSHFVP